MQNSRAGILRVFQAGDSDFVAAACAETDRPACFICKAASQKAQAHRVLRTTPLLQPNCDGVPLSKLLCILGSTRDGKDTKDGRWVKLDPCRRPCSHVFLHSGLGPGWLHLV